MENSSGSSSRDALGESPTHTTTITTTSREKKQSSKPQITLGDMSARDEVVGPFGKTCYSVPGENGSAGTSQPGMCDRRTEPPRCVLLANTCLPKSVEDAARAVCWTQN